jgi:hypothetical protein
LQVRQYACSKCPDEIGIYEVMLIRSQLDISRAAKI